MSIWKEYYVRDVVSTIIDYRGKTPKKLGGEWSNKGYRAFSAKNIKTGKIVQEDSIKYVSREMYKNWMKVEIERGDILLTSEAPFGQVYYWDSDEKIVLSQRLFAIRVNNRFYPKFIYFFMTTKRFQAELDRHATGTTVIGLRQDELMRCKIQAPNYETQIKIANLLWSIERKIHINEKINQNLEQQAQAIFSVYYDSVSFQRPFTDRIQILGGGTPKTGNPDFWNGDIPFFSPKDVGSPYTFQTEKYITQSGLNHCNSKLYPANTCFVTARGTVGKVSLAGRPMAMNQSCYALMSDNIDPFLVYFYALKVVASLKYKASGAVFDAIITRDFETEYISFLDKGDDEKALRMIRPMMNSICSNTEENLRLNALRDTLLPQLMSGELDVSDIDI